jgi:hypothetical protein
MTADEFSSQAKALCESMFSLPIGKFTEGLTNFALKGETFH